MSSVTTADVARFLKDVAGGKTATVPKPTTAMVKAEADGLNSHGLNVVRLLTLTGARKSKIEGLQWSEVDFARSTLKLADSKTGARGVPLGAAALALSSGAPPERWNRLRLPVRRQGGSPLHRNAEGVASAEAGRWFARCPYP